MHLIHIGRAPRYMADSVQSVVESSRRPGLRSADTADYVKHRLRSKFGERCFSYAGPAAWNSLPHSIKLIADTSRFKQLLKSHLFRIAFWHFVSAPGQFVSRALQVRICISICNKRRSIHSRPNARNEPMLCSHSKMSLSCTQHNRKLHRHELHIKSKNWRFTTTCNVDYTDGRHTTKTAEIKRRWYITLQ